MFSDMPQGDHKKRAKYRFASKTLMRILPSPQKEVINDLIERKEIQLDLYDILGKCTWREGGEPEPESPKPEEAKEGEGEKKEGEGETWSEEDADNSKKVADFIKKNYHQTKISFQKVSQ